MSDFDRAPDLAPRDGATADDGFRKNRLEATSAPPVDPPPSRPPATRDYHQWGVTDDLAYRPIGRAVPRLPPGCYEIQADQLGLYLKAAPMMYDGIAMLPDSPMIALLEEIKRFWDSRALYARHGLVYKRGIIMHGPPGGGKTIAIALLTRELIVRGGVVISGFSAEWLTEGLRALRHIEPTRPVIVILEDLDNLVAHGREMYILSALDGETQTDNVVYLATTNYPHLLGARLINRPSRFDRRIYVGMPDFAQRVAYLAHVAPDLLAAQAEQWAIETEGLSIAHIRELVVATHCLQADYADVLTRLRGMMEQPVEDERDGFKSRRLVGLIHGGGMGTRLR